MEFKETRPIEQGFAPIFAEKIAPHLDALEGRRQALQGKGQRYFKIALGLGAVAALAVVLLTGGSAGGIFGGIAVFIVFLIGGAVAKGGQSGKYTGALSDLVMPPVCDFLGDTAHEKRPGAVFDTQHLATLGLVDLNDHASFEDRIHGTYRGLSFELAEAHLTQDIRQEDDKTTSKKVFDGLLVRIGLPMHATTDILVTRELGTVGNSVLSFLAGDTGRGMPKVETGHAEFEAAYALHAKDPEAAMTLMKPPLLQALIEIGAHEADKGAEGFRAAFEGKTLWLALSRNRPFMQMGSIDASAHTVVEDLHGIFDDLSLVRRVIDRLHDS